MPTRKFTDEHAKTLHSEGYSAYAAAKKLEVNRSTVWKCWNRLGLRSDFNFNGPRRDITDSQLRAVHSIGLSACEAGRRLGVTDTFIHKHWKRIGLKSDFESVSEAARTKAASIESLAEMEFVLLEQFADNVSRLSYEDLSDLLGVPIRFLRTDSES